MILYISKNSVVKYLIKFVFLLFIQNAQGQTSFYFNGEEVKAGTKKHFNILITDNQDSTFIPISVFNGAKSGSVLGITAGIHGYEYPPIIAAQKLINSINPLELEGTVILVQIANLESFTKRSPFTNPIDNKNLNRVFPGKKNGTITEQIGFFISENVITKSHYFIDMHSGDAPEDLMPYAAYYSNDQMTEISNKGKKMAISLAFDHVIVFNTNGKSYMKQNEPSLYCSAEAFKRGIPAIDIECGHLGKAEPFLIKKIESSVLNLMQHLKMIKNDHLTNSNNPIIINNRFYIEAKYQGIFYASKKAGEYVSKGMKLGYITDFFGNTIDTVHANANGIILMIVATPPINIDETIAVIGEVN
ncbi:MAG: succinylglutamate desuccinylase [Thalassobius sp.]|nr:succinylglutamate desuccinylase [Thalassovita sp.]